MEKIIQLTLEEAEVWLMENGTGSLTGFKIEDPLISIVDVEGARLAGMLVDGEEVKVTITTDTGDTEVIG